MLPEGWSDRVMGRMLELDERMDAKGYLRLCTKDQTVRLMGNVISEEVTALAAQSGLSTKVGEQSKMSKGIMNRLAQVKWIRYLMQGVVNRFYRWLN